MAPGDLLSIHKVNTWCARQILLLNIYVTTQRTCASQASRHGTTMKHKVHDQFLNIVALGSRSTFPSLQARLFMDMLTSDMTTDRLATHPPSAHLFMGMLASDMTTDRVDLTISQRAPVHGHVDERHDHRSGVSTAINQCESA